MKPIYKSVILTQATLAVSLSLQANVYSGDATATQAVPAESLQGLRVQLVSPNVSGARDLIASGECTIDGATLNVNLNAAGLIQGTHRLVVKAEFGTQTVVLYGLNITVPASFEEGDAQEFEDTITVVSTMGDGGESTVVDTEITEDSKNPVTSAAIYAGLAGKQPVGNYADGAVYAKDEENNAHITKPLTISGSVQEGNPYGEDIYELNVAVLTPEQKAKVETTTGTAYDYCNTNDEIPDGKNVTIYADEECTQKVGSITKTEYVNTPIEGDLFNLQEGESISEGTYYARVERGTSGTYSHAEGKGTIASGDSSHAEGSGTNASGIRSHAEGSDATASGICSHAEGDGTNASGICSHAEGGGTTASGICSHAEGEGTTARGNAQHVCGKYNVEDTDGNYALIVGNGTDYQNRSNAFAIDWNGNLVLFDNGTPVVLTPAKLATLIA